MNSEQVTTKIATARRTYQVADHILGVTYPVAKDPKLLLGVVDNCQIALMAALEAYLLHERFFRRVPAFSATKESMIHTLSQTSARSKLAGKILTLLDDIDQILQNHKKASMEFTRDSKLVMTSDNMNLHTLSLDQTKEIVTGTKNGCEELIAAVEKGGDVSD